MQRIIERAENGLEKLLKRGRRRVQLGIGIGAEQGDGPDTDGPNERHEQDIFDEGCAVFVPPKASEGRSGREVR